ncbi:MAG: TlpA family protein disulfide reductase [Clostridia bacterium]|nr:TlpA family protein disulfide reductase [Clostridia bacterium]
MKENQNSKLSEFFANKRNLAIVIGAAAAVVVIAVATTLIILLGGSGGACEHSFGDWQVKTPATCTATGVDERVCSLCSETETRTSAARGHQGTGEKCTECGAILSADTFVTKTVSVKSGAGMAFAGITVYAWPMVDGERDGEPVGALTDENGVATLTLNKNTQYSIQVNGAPKGYKVQELYPLVGTSLDIVLTSSVITDDTSLFGVAYELGDVMKDFTVTTIDGKTLTLSTLLEEKKAVLINFFFTTCGPCVNEFQYMQSVYNRYKNDIAIIAIDNIDDLEKVKNFRDQYDDQMYYPENVLGIELELDMVYSKDTSLAESFGVKDYPTSIVVDRYGVISLIEVGGLPEEEPFDLIFKHFSADNYQQKLLSSVNELVEQKLPDVEQADSDTVGAVLDKGGFDITYAPDDDEYSWPFVIDNVNGRDCVKSSNAKVRSSYAIMYATMNLKAGDVMAFDYMVSSEQYSDILYVIVNDKDMYQISGEVDEWTTCYPFVATEDGEYELAFCYQKDSTTNTGDDTAYISNIRIVSIPDIDTPSYVYRFAATDPNDFDEYQKYVDIFKGSDGYYHVGSANGPILIANLMGYSRFAEDDTVYFMAVEAFEDGNLTEAEYDELVDYCNYASNAMMSGICSVNEGLMKLLKKIALIYGDVGSDNEWLEFCCYYDAYGTNGEQLIDPIKGLATYSAYDTVLSTTPISNDSGNIEEDFPNEVTYTKVIMPRGYIFAFTPEQSGTYKISSYTGYGENNEVNAWIFKESNFADREVWLTYSNVTREIDPRDNNCYMMAYLEAGETYYIDIAYYDVYQTGTIRFRVERVGGEGYHRFTAAAPGYFVGDMDNMYVGGIEVELGDDGYWHEKRTDGREGSLIYLDVTDPTSIFTTQSMLVLIENGAFNFSYSENDQYLSVLRTSTSACEVYLTEYLKDLWGNEYEAKCEEYNVAGVFEGEYTGPEGADGNKTPTAKEQQIIDWRTDMKTNEQYNTDENFKTFLKTYWGDDYDEQVGIYQLDEYLDGTYHGTGDDLTAEMRTYINKAIKAGDSITVVNEAGQRETIVVQEGDPMIGTVAVDARLAEILQMLMDKYTFQVENSWTKICYYRHYFCSATPI